MWHLSIILKNAASEGAKKINNSLGFTSYGIITFPGDILRRASNIPLFHTYTSKENN